MFARVISFDGSSGQEERTLSGPAPVEIQKMHGFKGAYALENRESGKAMLITLWETEADLRASNEAGKRLRDERVRQAGGASSRVDEFVVLTHP